MRSPVVFVLLVGSGCIQAAQPADSGIAEVSAAPGWSPAFGEATVAVKACAYASCYEPTIASDPQGRLFVADGSTSAIGVSTDGGRTWVQKNPPPMPSGLTGSQSDVIVQAAPSGRLYWSALVVARPVQGSFVLEGLQVAWSDDAADTWAGNVHLSPLTRTAEVVAPDRQWLSFGPAGHLYVTYNQVPTGIWIARSTDGGATWSGWTRAAPLEGRGGGIGQSGPPVVDSKGRVFVPACDIANAGTRVFVSRDQARSFTSTLVPGPCSWFPMLGVGWDDSLVLAVSAGAVSVARSVDGGATFTKLKEWARGATAAPWPIVRDDGEAIVAWYEGDGSSSDLVVGAGPAHEGPDRRVIVADGMGTSGSRTSALTDFASMARLPDGRLALTWVVGNTAVVSVG